MKKTKRNAYEAMAQNYGKLLNAMGWILAVGGIIFLILVIHESDNIDQDDLADVICRDKGMQVKYVESYFNVFDKANNYFNVVCYEENPEPVKQGYKVVTSR